MQKILPFLFLLSALNSSFAQDRIILNADQGQHTINKHIYGHFAEHLGRCIYDGFYVGEGNTRIPNTAGVRNDIVEALRKLKIPNLRWPGGCFADTYHWKDGIGSKDRRPTIVNTWWGGVTEDNSFGTHDFLNMCELLGAEPFISGNVGSGTVQELADWIQYTTFEGQSPMSKLRRENGRDKPWKVRFWGIGNEAWGCGGNMRAEYYADIYRQYATYMNASWDDGDRIYRIANGASSGDYHWTETLMKNIPHNMMEGLGLHHYSVIDWSKKSSAAEFTTQEYLATMQRAFQMEELVQRHSTIMDKYDPAKRVGLIVDEWGGWYDVEPGTNPGFLFQQNTMRDAMIAGITLNIFNNHADRVRMANLAQTINVLQAVVLTEGEKMILTPTYHVMEMYAVHQDATLLPMDLKTGMIEADGRQIPAVSASASRDAAGTIHISLVNVDPSAAHEVEVTIRGVSPKQPSSRILTSPKVQDHNTFAQPEKVKPAAYNGFSLKDGVLRVTLPPVSVVVVRI